MAIQIKRVLFSSVIVLSVFSASSAYCQTAQPKLTIGNITLYNLQPDGFYNNGNVNLNLERGTNPAVGFSISVQHVRTLDDVYDKLKPAIDDLSRELKEASEGFHPPH